MRTPQPTPSSTSALPSAEYFLPDVPSVDVIITTRRLQARKMTALKAVELADMEVVEAAELLIKTLCQGLMYLFQACQTS
jgi:hypothetical protein